MDESSPAGTSLPETTPWGSMSEEGQAGTDAAPATFPVKRKHACSATDPAGGEGGALASTPLTGEGDTVSKRGRVAGGSDAAAGTSGAAESQAGAGRRTGLGSAGRSHSLNRENHARLLINFKTYKDTLYGSLALEPVILRLMDTPQFQRLHGLKQLGTSDFVFRGSTNTRFEHSVGVGHLAQRFAESLRCCQPELGISKVDVMCVKIAGLLHDLGHGPYSHMWDEVFVRHFGIPWRHETGSVEMFRYMLKENKIDLSSYDPEIRPEDVTFIEEMILGTPSKDRKGRGAEKEFLYDIVNNTRSGLDVDKLDYFQRDARNTLGDRTINLDRFIDLARVLPALDENGELHRMICYPDKLWTEALALFRTRHELHQFVYQHKGGKSVDLMLLDAFVLADPYFTVPGSVDEKHPDGRWRLSESIFDCQAYTSLKDSTVDLIMNDPHPRLAPAKVILERLRRRQIYPCVGATEFDYTAMGITEAEAARRMVDILKQPAVPALVSPASAKKREQRDEPRAPGRGAGDEAGESDTDLEEDGDEQDAGTAGSTANGSVSGNGSRNGKIESADQKSLEEGDIIVDFMCIHWGLKGKNPVNRMRFFSKYTPWDGETRGVRLDENKFASSLPRQFETKKIRIFVRDMGKVDAARKAFDIFCRELRCASPCPLLSQDEDTT